ncbi:MAG: 50S ribosomal protein L25/general stress protein Ctc [Kineosporiaceae bacterium]|nr:50S ribosomal protein L25/general stress protein Ctc [Kineosporiaceae bacterium]
MSEVKLTAEKRTEFGKGAARRLRRAHKVPAVLYGHGTDPVHLALPGHDTMMALKQSNTLLTLDLGESTQLALPKDIQRHAIKGFIEHVDLLLVRRGEKVTVDVPLHVVGDAANGTLVTSELTTLSIEVEATRIPSSIEVSVEGLEAGARILAGEVALPAGSTLETDPESLVLQVSLPDDEGAGAEAAEGEAGAEAAEAE